jgi:hypothetical protein
LTIYVGHELLNYIDIVVPVLNGVKHDAKREKAGLESIIPTKSGCDARPKRRVWRIDKWKMRDEQWEI